MYTRGRSSAQRLTTMPEVVKPTGMKALDPFILLRPVVTVT
jgi:hypothetical protein